ncbi:MAG: Gfo/Idh/MocA family oxidoreductase [Prolixibacteraceae bacterium]|nr:Gfo/Idh/MocA family oxidoreductase [Prolixibacteraceae bacterium]
MKTLAAMKNIERRSFIKKLTVASTGAMLSVPMVKNSRANSPNESVNMAVVGIRSRGKSHYRALSKIPNVNIVAICDIDQRLLPEAVAEIEKLTGKKPVTETDYRKILKNKDIDAVSIATPNHWHALQTIWACQAGKDVYVEKPVSHTIEEGRKMVEAARKYNRVVQTGTQARSQTATINAMNFLNEDGLGKIFMARGLCLKPRGSIGHVKNSEIPNGVDWNTFLGPAPYRPFNKNRFHYKWHWFWDTGCGDLGNQGIHQADIARWALGKLTHPVRIQGVGNYFIWDSDQETPNMQQLEFEYEDGTILQFEVRGLGTNAEAGIRVGDLVFGSKGWMSLENEDVGNGKVHYSNINIKPDGYSSYKEDDGPGFTNDVPAFSNSVVNHFTNFIECVKSRKWQNLNADILEGHLSTSLCHLGNIASRLKRTLYFNPNTEKFVNDEEADTYLTKIYRPPFLLPQSV